MNILVTGANGQLGRAIRELAVFSGAHFIFTDVSAVPGLDTVYLDITDKCAVSLIAQSEHVDLFVNCAAYTNVDGAEDDIDMARLLNVTAVANLAQVAKEREATLIHISTDYIFSGNLSRPIRENDEPNPCSVYGATKLAGENEVQRAGCKALIIRTSWMYSPFGKNFVKTMARLMEQKRKIKVVNDAVGTPTYAFDLAAVIIKIIDEGLYDRIGTYHFSNEGIASWYDLAVAVARLRGYTGSVLPVAGSEYPTRARRPAYSVLDKSLIKKTFDVVIPYWRDSLEECLKRMK